MTRMTDPQMPTPLPGTMPPLEKPGQPPADFDPLASARAVLRAQRVGALGTIDRHAGYPMTTLVTVGLAMNGAPVFLLSGLASHTANLKQDARASLLLSETGKGDPLNHPRLTLLGPVHRVEDEAEEAQLRAFFLARHPKAKLYVGFGDFAFFRMSPISGHFNGGFARAADLKGNDLLVNLDGAEDLAGIATSALEHMNTDHRDSLQKLAAAAGTPGQGRWRMSGLDPEGFDLIEGDESLRIAFPQRVTSGDALRNILATMVKQAGNKPI